MENITAKTYEKICSQWAKTIILLSESEMDIWPPLSGTYALVREFLKDKDIQKKLFGDLHPSLVLVDGHELEDFTFQDFTEQFFASLNIPSEGTSADEYLGKNSRLLGLFVVGFDTALRHKNTTVLKQIGTLLEKHSHLSLVFISELNIPESPLFHDLVAKSMLVQNIYYQKVFSTEDALQYLSQVEKEWRFSLKNGLDKLMSENIGGHLLLLKEAARIARDNPELSIKQILAAPSLVRKALAIYQLLTPEDKKTIHSLLTNPTKQVKASEYLLQTGLVANNKVGLQYWSYLIHNVIEEKDLAQQDTSNFNFHLTQVEQKILEKLQASQDIVARDSLSRVIWGEDWELRYSDWALGQIMHRLREKLSQHHAPFTIETKKGEGFYLQQQ